MPDKEFKSALDTINGTVHLDEKTHKDWINYLGQFMQDNRTNEIITKLNNLKNGK